MGKLSGPGALLSFNASNFCRATNSEMLTSLTHSKKKKKAILEFWLDLRG